MRIIKPTNRLILTFIYHAFYRYTLPQFKDVYAMNNRYSLSVLLPLKASP